MVDLGFMMFGFGGVRLGVSVVGFLRLIRFKYALSTEFGGSILSNVCGYAYNYFIMETQR